MVELWESLVAVGFGFALGFGADLARERIRRAARKRNLATVLGAEVKSIERMAESSVDGLKQRLAQADHAEADFTFRGD